ncbi:MAG: Zn-dependent alcohol dehydrogenase [Acidimicrobiales bacterium]|nr:Zn-dependent alcohol dehydrogenase [Acidimicrobiales bacterium]
MTLIKAAVCREPKTDLTIEEIRLSDPEQDEIRVTVEACAICHSDITYIDGGWSIGYPVVLGHEVSGKIAEIGPETETELSIGDQVVVSLIRTCGQCLACKRGHDVACTGKLRLHETSPLEAKTGEILTHGLNTGGFAEEVVVHISQCVPVPKDLPVNFAALLGCGVMTGMGAVFNTAKVESGDITVIVGCGGVGLAAIQGAKISGAEYVIAVDPLANKRELAIKFGATHAFEPSEDLSEIIQETTEGYLADFTFVSTAAPSAISMSMNLLSPMGALVLVGMPEDGVKTEFDPGLLAARNQRILGSKMGTSRPHSDIPAMVDLWRDGKLDLENMVSSTHSLENINDALNEMRNGSVIRAVVCPGS